MPAAGAQDQREQDSKARPMGSLTDKAGGNFNPSNRITRAMQSWETSMARRLDSLRGTLLGADPRLVADQSGASFGEGGLRFRYWDRAVEVTWPDLGARYANGGSCSTFDTAMLLYYLTIADGSPLTDRWIGFRELPGGAFYNQAFQGYSGDRIASAFSECPQSIVAAARYLGGLRLPALSDFGFAFQPLPRIRLATVLWLGDEDFPSRAMVLFDASSSHYMITDGLALLGSGIASRLIEAREQAGLSRSPHLSNG
jgi:hypothetical protein